VTQVQRLVAGLDLGSSKVTGVIGEVTGDARTPGVKILGASHERTSGVRRGVVRDIEETTRAIGKAMRDAQLMAGVEVGTVYCGVAGEHVSGRSSHGVVSVTGSEIRTGDVARVNDVAANVSFGLGHELLHAIPQDYIVDGQTGITDPIGMTGSRLEAEVYLVTALGTALQNVRKCVERAGFSVGEFVLEPLAASLAVLTHDERDLGCALVELGGGSTTVSVFHEGKIRHFASMMFAGQHVTNDIVHGLQVTQQEAERIKQRFGAAYEPLASNDDTFELPGTPGQGVRMASTSRARAYHSHAAAGSAGARDGGDLAGRISAASPCRRDPDWRGEPVPRCDRARAGGVRAPCQARRPGFRTHGTGGQRGKSADGGAGRTGALRRAADRARELVQQRARPSRGGKGAGSGETVVAGLLLSSRVGSCPAPTERAR
jgi:cell division protein FtsA